MEYFEVLISLCVGNASSQSIETTYNVLENRIAKQIL